MMSPELKNIFAQSQCLSDQEIADYVAGKLSLADNRRIELHLADCEICSDLAEAYSYFPNTQKLPKIVDELNQSIDSFIQKERFIQPKQTTNKPNFKRIFAVAASVILLISIAYFINTIGNKSTENLAQNETTDILKPSNTNNNELSGGINKSTEAYEKSFSEQTNNEREKVEPNETQSTQTDNITNDEQITANNKTTEDTDIDNVVFEDAVSEINTEYNDNAPITTDKELKEEESKDNKTNNLIGLNSRSASSSKKESGASDETVATKNRALLSYKIKSYQEAAEDFDTYLLSSPNDTEILYKSGMCYYMLKNYTTAIARFDNVLALKKSVYTNDAQWYKSQALINSGKNKEAAGLLQIIIDEGGKYSQKAMNTLNQIKGN